MEEKIDAVQEELWNLLHMEEDASKYMDPCGCNLVKGNTSRGRRK